MLGIRSKFGDPLNYRELQILKGIVELKSNKEIARELGLSYRTVECYRLKMRIKLGVRNVGRVGRKGSYIAEIYRLYKAVMKYLFIGTVTPMHPTPKRKTPLRFSSSSSAAMRVSHR